MIIDTHTHYGTCYEERDGLDPTRWLGTLDHEGVDGAILMTHRGLMPNADARQCNDDLAEVVSRAPHRLVAFGSVNPFAGPQSVKEAERCLTALGMKGLKWHPWVQGFLYVGGEEVHAICDLCGSQDAPILFHDGTPNVSMPSQVALLAKAHSETVFILGHAGLMHLWRHAAEAAALHENIYITLCGPHPAALRHICREVPTERLLWGSDYGPSFVNLINYRKKLIGLLGPDQEQYNGIMGGDAARLLRWRPWADGNSE